MPTRFNAAFTALLAAALFGATTPLAKALLGSLSPFLLAGLFYLGSGTGLAAVILARRLKGQAEGSRSVTTASRCAKCRGSPAQSWQAVSRGRRC